METYQEKFRTSDEQEKTTLSMTSMIDIVFLLVIFFMCATNFRKPDYRLDAHLPRKVGQRAVTVQTPEDIPEFRITVEKIDAPRGSIRARFRIGRNTYVPVHKLDDMIKNLYSTLSDRPDLAGKDIPAVIAGDKEVDFEYIIKAVDACISAKVDSVQFAM